MRSDSVFSNLNLSWTELALEKGAIACDPSYAYRSFDGSCNNLQNPSQGAVGSKFLHGTFAGTSYSRSYDQQGNPVEGTFFFVCLCLHVHFLTLYSSFQCKGPSARLISNKVFAAAGLDSIPSKDGIAATHIFWYALRFSKLPLEYATQNIY